MKLNVGEWQKRLEDTFSVGEIVGGSLLEVLDAESDYYYYYYYFITTRCHSHLVLMDSFGAFSVETFRLAEARYCASLIDKLGEALLGGDG